MPPEAEENGTHAQKWEVNCSLQRVRCSAKSRECAQMLIAAGGRTASTEHGVGKKKKKKKDFHYSETNQLFRNSYSNFDFLIISNSNTNSSSIVPWVKLQLYFTTKHFKYDKTLHFRTSAYNSYVYYISTTHREPNKT